MHVYFRKIFNLTVYIYIKKSNEIRMLVHIKEIIKKKNKTDFSQHSIHL